jgi:hypothetical protein
MLKDHQFSTEVTTVSLRMKPTRQVECARTHGGSQHRDLQLRPRNAEGVPALLVGSQANLGQSRRTSNCSGATWSQSTLSRARVASDVGTVIRPLHLNLPHKMVNY